MCCRKVPTDLYKHLCSECHNTFCCRKERIIAMYMRPLYEKSTTKTPITRADKHVSEVSYFDTTCISGELLSLPIFYRRSAQGYGDIRECRQIPDFSGNRISAKSEHNRLFSCEQYCLPYTRHFFVSDMESSHQREILQQRCMLLQAQNVTKEEHAYMRLSCTVGTYIHHSRFYKISNRRAADQRSHCCPVSKARPVT
jgi:hypothetical protein